MNSILHFALLFSLFQLSTSQFNFDFYDFDDESNAVNSSSTPVQVTPPTSPSLLQPVLDEETPVNNASQARASMDSSEVYKALEGISGENGKGNF